MNGAWLEMSLHGVINQDLLWFNISRVLAICFENITVFFEVLGRTNVQNPGKKQCTQIIRET